MLCAHLFPRAMGKRGSDGALVKRPASNVSSIQGALLSDVVVAELEATRNVNDFRKRARALGVSTQYKNSDGQWRDRARADILDECRRRLEESRAPAHAAASVSAGAPQPSHPSSADDSLVVDLDVSGLLPSATSSSMAGGEHAIGEIQVSAMSADELNSITDFDLFRRTAVKCKPAIVPHHHESARHPLQHPLRQHQKTH